MIHCLSAVFVASLLSLAALSANGETFPQPAIPPNIAALREKLHAPRNDAPMIAAHRGDWRNHPENSLAAIRSCIAMGLEIVEIDVRLSADGIPMLMHDKTLERMSNGSGKISHRTAAQLGSLRLKSADGTLTDEPLPTLQQALELCRGRILVFIDKAEHCLPAVAKVIQETGMDAHVILYIRQRVTRAEFRRQFGPLMDTRVIFIPLIRAHEAGGEDYIKDVEQFLNPPAYAVEFAEESFDLQAFTFSVAKLGAGVFACSLWPPTCGGRDDEKALVDPDQNWGWLAKSGVRCFVTDRPEQLKKYLTREAGK
ncbi:MAG: glycerophosphodiester phosphodiesterase family protein [Luteolibacter sp.]